MSVPVASARGTVPWTLTAPSPSPPGPSARGTIGWILTDPGTLPPGPSARGTVAFQLTDPGPTQDPGGSGHLILVDGEWRPAAPVALLTADGWIS